jgi:hypothetical protein
MPFEIKLDEPVHGYTLDAALEGQTVAVRFEEFTSSENGELFISRLEGIPQQLLSLLPSSAGIQPSRIDHLVGIIRKDLTTTLYVNECNVLVEMRAGRAVKAGEGITEDAIVDIDRLSFEGVHFQADAGIVCVFSAGWREGFYFDLSPLIPDRADRTHDVEERLGSYMAYLQYQQLFSLSESDWDFMIQRGWFPFVTLPKRIARRLISFAQSRIDLDEVLPEAVEAVTEALPTIRERWSESELLRPHVELLMHALDEFAEDDYISCTSIIYPRIEGILRSIHVALGKEESASQRVLAQVSTEARQEELHPHSWLLPDKFRRFMQESYFAHFTPGQPAELSRNTVGHGVATAEQFNEKAACLGLLVVDQLFFYLPTAGPDTDAGGVASP